MKKVLIIAYSFPPRKNIGAQRPYGLAKYFPEYGWEPIVLTAKVAGKRPEGIRVIETDYKDVLGSIKSKFGFNEEEGLHQQLGIPVSKNFDYNSLKSKTIKLLKEVIAFPDSNKGLYKFALKSASELLNREKINVILSTSYPVTSHLVATKLKQKSKIPSIADFRDLWTQNHYYNKFSLIRYLERQLELRTLNDADFLVAVSNPFKEMLKSIHKEKIIFCVTNGYGEDDFAKLPSQLTNKLTITYTGQLYNGKRDPELLFRAVAQLINENRIDRNLIEIRFFGSNDEWVVDEVKEYGLNGVVNLYGFITREETLEKQKESQLLLLLLWNNKNEKAIYTGKAFEYLAARRPIIAIGGAEGVVKELLEETNSGKSINNITEMKKYLSECYQEFIKQGEVKYSGNKNIEKYSHRNIARKYSDILNNVVV